MASSTVNTSSLPVVGTLTGTDRVLVLSNTAGSPTTSSIRVMDLTGNSEFLQVISTPANGTVTTVRSGALLTDGSYLYVAVSTNVLKRVTLQTF